MLESTCTQHRSALQVAALPLALLLLATPHLLALIEYWSLPYSYVISSPIALLCAVLALATAPRRTQAEPPGHAALARVGLLSCTALYLLATILFARRSIAGVALAGIALALVYEAGGRRRVLRHSYALGFLLLAAPIPGVLVEVLNRQLVAFASQAGAWLLGLFVAGSTREGNVLLLPEHGTLQVVDDCSGLEGIALFFVLSILLLYLHPRLTRRVRPLVPLLAVSLALCANVLRILATGLLQAADSPLAISESFHQFVGTASLALALVLLYLIVRGLEPRAATEGTAR